jgi:hypothetical protein
LGFLIKFNNQNLDEELPKVVRVTRNLLQATRQRNETRYNTNIRINNFGSYWILLEQFISGNIYTTLIRNTLNYKGSQISDLSLRNEIEKVSILLENNTNINNSLIELEEFEYFGGLIHLLEPKELNEYFPEYIHFFIEVFDNKISSSLKLRALIACGFEGIYTKNCRMGEMYYFGKNGNWTTILTSEKEDVSKSVIELINKYYQYNGTPETKLNAIVNDWLQNNSENRTWKYYFIKYPEFTSKLNYFVNAKLFEARILGTEGSNPLVAYHISPYVLTACKRINNKHICNADDCYLQYSGNSPLMLKNGITLTPTQQGWHIDYNHKLLSSDLKKQYHIDEDSNILKEIDNRDRIQIVVDFINDIYKL